MVKRAKAEPLMRPFKGFGTLRERGSDANSSFPVEFLTYHEDSGKLRIVRIRAEGDGGDIPDGHYVFLDELGERSLKSRHRAGRACPKGGQVYGQAVRLAVHPR